MPELPEVETVARSLRAPIVGRAIRRVDVLWPRTVAAPPVEAFRVRLEGRTVLSVGRRGKYLVFELDRGFLLVHLKMSGRLRFLAAGSAEPPGPHTRLVLHLDDGRQLRFDDARKFGRVYALDDPEDRTAGLGPEPLAAGFCLDDWRRLLRGRKGRLKSLLLNQEFLAGLGNIYADEVLFAARLHPLRTAASLDGGEQARLYDAIRDILGRAVAGRGTTLDDRGYVDALGVAGGYQEELAVYGRGGQPCPRCATPVERIVVAGRSTHFCPTCQPPPLPRG